MLESSSTRSVKGLAQLQRFLDTLPAKMEKNIMTGALRAGARPILLDARSRIHSRSGELAAGLRVSVRARQGKITARIVASGGKRSENKPIWVEFGTRPHFISVTESDRPINPKASSRAGHVVRVAISTINKHLRIGTRFVGPSVFHPGAKRSPFLRPAMDAKATEALIAVGEYIKKRLTKEGIDASGVRVEAG